MKFTWKITHKTEEIFVGQNWTPKMSVLLEEAEEKQYKDSVLIDFMGEEKVAQVKWLNLWQVVTVSFNLRASEYNGKHYNNLSGRRVDSGKTGTNSEPTTGTGAEPIIKEDFEDLPF